jgi:hypothetical protein
MGQVMAKNYEEQSVNELYSWEEHKRSEMDVLIENIIQAAQEENIKFQSAYNFEFKKGLSLEDCDKIIASFTQDPISTREQDESIKHLQNPEKNPEPRKTLGSEAAHGWDKLYKGANNAPLLSVQYVNSIAPSEKKH